MCWTLIYIWAKWFDVSVINLTVSEWSVNIWSATVEDISKTLVIKRSMEFYTAKRCLRQLESSALRNKNWACTGYSFLEEGLIEYNVKAWEILFQEWMKTCIDFITVFRIFVDLNVEEKTNEYP